MKTIPAICVDDFYTNPNEIRRFALEQKYSPAPNGDWPGCRTKDLHLIDRLFFDRFCDKLFSLFFDLTITKVEYRVKTNFQIVEPMDEDPASPKNQGWVHFDDNTIFAGIIFLTPNADLDCGTSIFKLVDETKLNLDNTKSDFFKDRIDNDYDRKITTHRSAYVETIRYNNIYNRLIAFDGTCAHAANNFYSSQPRLTQVFFVEKVETDTLSPIYRHKQFL